MPKILLDNIITVAYLNGWDIPWRQLLPGVFLFAQATFQSHIPGGHRSKPCPKRPSVSPLESIITRVPANVDSKALTENLNPLEATLTKIRGGWWRKKDRSVIRDPRITEHEL